jgi:hypothetical protein
MCAMCCVPQTKLKPARKTHVPFLLLSKKLYQEESFYNDDNNFILKSKDGILLSLFCETPEPRIVLYLKRVSDSL